MMLWQIGKAQARYFEQLSCEHVASDTQKIQSSKRPKWRYAFVLAGTGFEQETSIGSRMLDRYISNLYIIWLTFKRRTMLSKNVSTGKHKKADESDWPP